MEKQAGFVASRVVVVRALPGLGDILCVVPALRALRAGLPQAHVSLIGLPAVRSIVERFPRYIDALLPFPGYPGIPEQSLEVERVPGFLADMQRRQFDLAIQMHGSGVTTNPFTFLLGARRTAGLYIPGNYCPDPGLFLPYDEHVSEVRRYLRLLDHLGFSSQGEHLEFPVTPEDRAELRALPEWRALANSDYVCIHPGAKDPARRLSPEAFAAIGDELANQGFRVVLTGTGSEAEITHAVAIRMKRPPIDMAGRTGLGGLAALFEGSRLLVCNDTGVSHLAAALRVPSVVIFTTTDPARWAPLDRDLHRVVQVADLRAVVGQSIEQALSLLGKEASRVA